jgi:hypothetical protein
MLNELYLLSKVLQNTTIKPQNWNKNYKQIRKLNIKTGERGYKILVGEKNNNIMKIEKVAQENIEKLRKWEKSNGFSFPCFNMGRVIPNSRKLFEEEMKNQVLTYENMKPEYILEYRKKNATSDQTNKEKRLAKCLGELPEALYKIIGDPPEEYKSIQILIKRLKGITPTVFIEAIVEYIHNNKYNEEFLPLFFSDSLVFLDVDDYGVNSGCYPVCREDTQLWINERLNEYDTPKTSNNTSETKEKQDSFGFNPVGHNTKLPSVKLPFLGIVILRSMVGEAPCQFRYGKADYDSFSIGNTVRGEVKSALEWLAQDDFQWKTWDIIGHKELLFGYPSELPKPNLPPELISILSGPEADSAVFKKITSEVLETLKGYHKPLNEIEVRLFALKKMDDARTKVVYDIVFRASELENLAEEWEKASENIPTFRVFDRDRGSGEERDFFPYIPKPFEFNRIFDYINNHGTQRKQTSSPENKLKKKNKEFARTIPLDILLDKTDTLTLSHLLHYVLNNTSKTIISTIAFMHRREIFDADANLHTIKLLIPIFYGVLLYKLKVRKEEYMESLEFLVGKLLSLSDDLHFQYCKYVRTPKANPENSGSGKINLPPELLGCALVNTALHSPVKALSILSERIRPYIAWAKTNQTEEYRLTRWMLRRYGDISRKIKESIGNADKRMGDKEKAILLLGYLEGIRKQDIEKEDQEDE